MSPSSALLGQNFSYGYGRIGVLQQQLPSIQNIDQLLETNSEADFVRVLSGLPLCNHVPFERDAYRLVESLEKWLRDEVRSMSPESGRLVFDILWLKGDGPLLAYLLKRHHQLTSSLSNVPHVGATAWEPADLQALITHGTAGSLPASLITFVEEIKAFASPSPRTIDASVAQFIAREQVRLARQSGSQAIIRYVSHHLDLLNIRTARRLKPEDKPAEHLLAGGTIDPASFTLDRGHLATLAHSCGLPASVNEAVSLASDTAESSLIIERGLAQAIARDVAQMRDVILAIEPIFAFAVVALSQFRLLQTLIVGKSTRLSPDEIRKLLPPYLSTSPFAA